MPKKPQISGYSVLMQEYIAAQKKNGRNVSMAQAQAEVSPMWQNMGPEERALYKEKAANQKTKVNKVKYTSSGIPIDFVIAEETAKVAAVDDMRSYIHRLVNSLASNKDKLSSHNFYFIFTNNFCVTLPGQHVPAEISVLRFNLLDGENAYFHRIINPREIPRGYRSDCMDLCKSTHQIPLPPYSDGRQNLAKPQEEHEVFEDLLVFFESLGETNPYPPMYTLKTHINKCKSNLKALNIHSSEIIDFRIFEFEQLLYDLKLVCVDGNTDLTFPTYNMAVDEVERDIYCYCGDISCEFHNEDELCENHYHYCSLSYVRRFLYTICDHCCTPLGIELIPSKHLPPKARGTLPSSSQASRASASASSFSATQSQKVVQDDEDDDDGFITQRHNKRRGVGRGTRILNDD